MYGFDNFYGGGFPHLDFSRLFAERTVEREAMNMRTQEEQLQIRLARLEVVCMALWSLMKEKTNLSDDDLTNCIQQIKGAQDGKSTTAPLCPQCNRPLSQLHHRCLYCGYTPPAGEFAAFQPPPQASGK